MRPARPQLMFSWLAIPAFLCACAAQRQPAAQPLAIRNEFDAAREVLLDMGFTLDRVDAAERTLTTMPRPMGGLGIEPASTLSDTLSAQSRTVRITWDDPPNNAAQPWGHMHVQATVSRTHAPALVVSSRVIGLSTPAYDPLADQPGNFETVLTLDEDLSAKIAARIATRLAKN